MRSFRGNLRSCGSLSVVFDIQDEIDLVYLHRSCDTLVIRKGQANLGVSSIQRGYDTLPLQSGYRTTSSRGLLASGMRDIHQYKAFQCSYITSAQVRIKLARRLAEIQTEIRHFGSIRVTPQPATHTLTNVQSMSPVLPSTIRHGVVNVAGTLGSRKLIEALLNQDRHQHHCFYRAGFHNHLSHQ